MIFGRGGIGGVVNRVTKTAVWQTISEIKLLWGSHGERRASLDITRPANDSLALRLNAVSEDSHSYRHGVHLNRRGVNPTVALRLGPDTLIQAGYEHFEDDRIADRGIPSRFQTGLSPIVGPLPVNAGQFFGDSSNSPTWTDTDALDITIVHKISPDLSIRSHLRFAAYDKAYQNIYANAVMDPAETLVSLAAYRSATGRENLISQTDLTAELKTGAFTHTLLGGLELGRQVTSNRRFEGRFAGGASSLVVPVVASDGRHSVSWIQTASSTDNQGVARVSAAYVQDQIELSPHLKLIAGLRFERFITEVDDRRVVGVLPGQPHRFKVTDDLLSPRIGLILKPMAAMSLYGAYSKTYQPRGGDQLTSLSLTNQSLAPEEFRNLEIGLKWDLNPGFTISAAVFRLDRSHVLALSDPRDASSAMLPIGRQRTEGLELAATGSLTDRLSVAGAYTLTDARFLDSFSGTVSAGNRPANLPKQSASLWARFQVSEPLAAALGWSHQGLRFAAPDNRVALPAYDRLDAALYYRLSTDLTVQLNLENLTQVKYAVFANSNNNITPGAPLAARITLIGKF
ncbi:MAG: TonB-dependent siderophore receptor [Phenylobacterium zucineum]|nr:MAG: TonB-dependent siderophore receptor [Phenylobacterium zucineum]